jgi:hypothetical protein
MDRPVARPLPAHRTTQTQNERTQTSLTSVGFEPTIPVFERAKTVYALDRAATVMGSMKVHRSQKTLLLMHSCAAQILNHSLRLLRQAQVRYLGVHAQIFRTSRRFSGARTQAVNGVPIA